MTGRAPAPALLRADPAWRRIDLLSDVHLHAGMPRTFDAWRGHLLGTSADAVLILGDLFEVWVGDDARHGDFESRCAEVLREAARRRFLGYLPGNRDFLVGDTLLAECGMQRMADPTVLLAWGRRWLLSHGDALCLADTAYQHFRQQVRGATWQQHFLALPLDERQRQARLMRDASTAHQAGQAPDQWSDVEPVTAAAWLAEAGADALIHGHTHRPGSSVLPGGRMRHVLGDWAFDHGVPRAQALRLDTDGLHALDLASGGAGAPP